jgi:hypothetical protein
MPDAHGNFKGISVPAAAWERIFGNAASQQPVCEAHGWPRDFPVQECCGAVCVWTVRTEHPPELPDPPDDPRDPDEEADRQAGRDGY